MPVSAFADTWYVDDGNITVNATDSGQTVSQGETTTPDDAPVITQRDSSTPTTNTVTVKAEENAEANVTIQDVNIVISDPAGSIQNHSGDAAVTIDVADGAAANVTLNGVNIDTGNTGGVSKGPEGEPVLNSGEAAVQITGNGDVTLELDGDNTLLSGMNRAGVEKNTTDSSGNGNLTITDESGTDGSLKATGGFRGAGIGGGYTGTGSNITITGSAEVTATGGTGGAGIGGGYESGSNITISGSAKVIAQGGEAGSGIGGGGGGSGSNITISDTAEVTANGGTGGAGIGGGSLNTGSNITITGSAEVYAKGGETGAGIGGGRGSSGSSDITVSGDAQVKAQGGAVLIGSNAYSGEGAAIGDGGKFSNSSPDNIAGEEKNPNTDGLTPNGTIEYYAPGANMETDDPVKTVSGTYAPPQDEEKPDEEKPDQPSQSAEESAADTVYSDPLYRVIDQNGEDIPHKAERKDGVLTVTVDADFASLTGKLGGIQTLKAQGIDTIVFVTKGVTSTFALSDLLAQGSTGDIYTLNHNGDTVSFTLGEAKTDINEILAQP